MGLPPDATEPELSRHLAWDGLLNVRDLGGHVTSDGGLVRRGALVRADNPMRLSAAGWRSLREHGIGTILDLRDPAVETGSYLDRAEGLDVVSAPVLQLGEERFWTEFHGESDATRFYLAALERWPAKFAGAVRGVAASRAGGVLVHCQVGKDRTGLVVALTLAAVGVAPADIAVDYGLSRGFLASAAEVWADDAELAAARGRTQLSLAAGSGAEAMQRVLESLDVHAYLEAGGVTDADLRKLRDRLVGID